MILGMDIPIVAVKPQEEFWKPLSGFLIVQILAFKL
jgi:hypothetical protein